MLQISGNLVHTWPWGTLSDLLRSSELRNHARLFKCSHWLKKTKQNQTNKQPPLPTSPLRQTAPWLAMQIFSSLIFKGRFNVTHHSEQHWAPQQTVEMVWKYKKKKCEPCFIRDSFMYSCVQNVLSHSLMSPFVWRLRISISKTTISEMCGFSNVCMQYLCSVFCI